MARKLQPDAITLDLGLADIDGFVLLDLLKHDPRDQPHPDPRHFGRRQGQIGAGAWAPSESPTSRPTTSELSQGLPPTCVEEGARPRRSDKAAPVEGPGAGAGNRSVPELAGAKILIVDDDIRNIYSLTSVLESYDVEVLHAERGKDGIVILEQTPGIDVALIDIMMPDMDGYETMQQIRAAARSSPTCR